MQHSPCATSRLRLTGTCVLLGFVLSRCVSLTSLQTTVPTFPSHPLTPAPGKVVIANAFDVKAKSFRDNKEEQFILLIEGAMTRAANRIKEHSGAETEVARGLLIPPQDRDSSMLALISSTHASHGLFITSFNAFFDQTHVEVTKTDDGKSREAFYDVVVEMGYLLRGPSGLSLDTMISVRKFHSSRNVLSGLLAAGPSIVSNHDDAQEGVFVNVDQYLKSFFPGKEGRMRNLYISKEFKGVSAAVKQSNFKAAFEAAEKLTTSTDKKIAAMAYYNCAVIAEHEGLYDQVKEYLQESLNRQYMLEAQAMLEDYRFQRWQ